MKVLIPFILLLAACSQPAPVARIAETPSGYPEAVFSGISAQKLANKIAARCVEKGDFIITSSASQVKCERRMTEENINWAKAYIGNPYADDIHHYIVYNIVKGNGTTRVQARQWIQLQMPYGQTKRREMNSPEGFNSGIRFLYSMGGKPV